MEEDKGIEPSRPKSHGFQGRLSPWTNLPLEPIKGFEPLSVDYKSTAKPTQLYRHILEERMGFEPIQVLPRQISNLVQYRYAISPGVNGGN